MEKPNQRVMLTKRLLKESLLQLLQEKPIEKIHVSELCAHSGINRATFYRHYGSPQDLLLEVEMDLTRQISNIATGTVWTARELEAYTHQLCQNIYDHAQEVKILLRHKSEMDFTRILETFYQELLRNRSDLQDSDELQLMATYFAGGGYFLLRRWLMDDIPKPPAEIAALLCSYVRSGCTFL